MKQITHDEGLIGKTIKRMGYLDNKLFLFFTDNTFGIVHGCGWDERDVELSEEIFNTEPSENNFDNLKGIGLIGDEEYNKLKAKKDRDDKVQYKNEELKELNKLKKKYPNHQSEIE